AMKPPLRRLQEFRSKRDFSIAANPGFCHSLDGGIGSSTRSSTRQACVFSAVVCRFAPTGWYSVLFVLRRGAIMSLDQMVDLEFAERFEPLLGGNVEFVPTGEHECAG